MMSDLNPAIWETIAATGLRVYILLKWGAACCVPTYFENRLLALAVAFLVFFAAAAGAGIIAADFGGGAHGFWRFGLGGAGLILQVLLLALLFAIELARYVG